MKKSRIFFSLVVCLNLILISLFYLNFISAINVYSVDYNSTLMSVYIANATFIYSYEINFVQNSSTASVKFHNVLGADTAQGSDSKNDIFSVYDSILNSTSPGVDLANNIVFNITHNKNMILRAGIFVYVNESEEEDNFCSENLSCGSWSSCTGGTQSRTCESLVCLYDDSVETQSCGGYCGDGSCNNGENCGTCTDCACSGSQTCNNGACVGGGSCFPAGTKVLMAEGSSKNIEDVRVGEYVKSFDKNFNLVNSKVLELEQPVHYHYYSIIFDDFSVLNVTNEHPIYIKSGVYSGWGSISKEATNILYPNIPVKQISIGDYVLKSDKTWKRIIAMKYYPGKIQTYNLKSIESSHTYFAEGVFVHNKPTCINACTSGTKECFGDGYRTCGDYDSDSCTEWSSVTTCSNGCSSSGDCVTITPECTSDAGCSDGNVCTDDSCNSEGKCVHSANTAICDDNNPCTLNDRCLDKICAQGISKTCDDSRSCSTDTCSVFTGECYFDTSRCQCTSDVNCSDNNVCTDNFCSGNRCNQTFNTNPCNDNNARTRNDRCFSGLCLGETITCGEGYVWNSTTEKCEKGEPPKEVPNGLTNLKEDCTSDFACGEWSGCVASYNINDIIDGKTIEGATIRTCKDLAGCKSSFSESQTCNFKSDIIAKKEIWCGEEYISLIDKMGQITSRMKFIGGKYEAVDINIVLNGKGYCAYCFDGIKNYDEEGLDCGGSCSGCNERELPLAKSSPIPVIALIVILTALIMGVIYSAIELLGQMAVIKSIFS